MSPSGLVFRNNNNNNSNNSNGSNNINNSKHEDIGFRS